MRKASSYVGIIAVIMAAGSGAQALDLVKNHRATGVLVVADGATEQEQWAVEQIGLYVRRMSGAKLQVRHAPPDENIPALLVGEIGRALVPDARSRLAADPTALVNDSFLISVRGNRGAIIGARPEAVCFGASELLASLGVRWYFPGEFGEVVPKKADINLPSRMQVYRPDYDVRDIWHAPRDYARHRKLTTGASPLAHGHSWHMWIGKEREEEPELRGMQGGERKAGVCYTNPRVAEIIIKNIKAYIAKTGAKLVSLCPDDGRVRCECAECQAVGTRDFANPFTRDLAATDQVMYLYNKVIPAVLEEYPGTLFTFYIYSDCLSPPKRQTVHPSLVGIAAPLAECPLHPTSSDNCPRRAWFRQSMQSWAKQVKRLYIYEYDPPVIWHGIMAPRAKLIAANIAQYKPWGIRGYSVESRPQACAESGLNYYIYSRLMWDNDLDVDGLLDEFCQSFYQEAAEPMRCFWGRSAEAMASLPRYLTGNEDINIHHLYTPKLMEELNGYLKQAEKDAIRRNVKDRIAMAQLVQQHTQAWLDSRRAYEKGDFIAAAAAIERMYQLKAALQEIEPELANPSRWDLATDSQPRLRWVENNYRNWARLCGQEGDEGQLVTLTDMFWDFRFDRLNRGLYEGWFTPEFDRAEWKSISTTEPWDYQGYAPDQAGIGWYATEVKVGEKWAGQPVHLYLTHLFGRDLTVWVNGQQVADLDLPYYFWHDYDDHQEIEITDALNYGGENLIVLRIYKEINWGGPYGRIFLYSPRVAQ